MNNNKTISPSQQLKNYNFITSSWAFKLVSFLLVTLPHATTRKSTRNYTIPKKSPKIYPRFTQFVRTPKKRQQEQQENNKRTTMARHPKYSKYQITHFQAHRATILILWRNTHKNISCVSKGFYFAN